jgi:hypothetical protein
MNIGRSETLISGNWLSENGRLVADEVCERINRLVGSHLQKVTSDPSGWETLYRDPEDDRYWELTYPKSELHGGGPPQLRAVSVDEAREKYGVAT